MSVLPASRVAYTLSLHAALPICDHRAGHAGLGSIRDRVLALRNDAADDVAIGDDADDLIFGVDHRDLAAIDRKSTRLNSSHRCTLYAVVCWNKKIGSRWSPRVDL